MAIELDFVPANHDHLHCQVEADEPMAFRLEIKQPQGDYFSFDEMIAFFELSPAMFVGQLRKYRPIIKIYSPRLTKQDRAYFYDPNVDSVDCIDLLYDATFHYLEARQLRRACVEERMAQETKGVQTYLGEIWGKPLDSPCTAEEEKPWERSLREKDANIERLENTVKVAQEQMQLLIEEGKAHIEQAASINDESVEKLARDLDKTEKELAAATQQINDLKTQLTIEQEKTSLFVEPEKQATGPENGKGQTVSKRWMASLSTVCRAVVEVCRSGRTDWVSGFESAGPTDSGGKETFTTLVAKLHPEGEQPVHSQAERAAWGVLAKMGYTWGAGPKPQKTKP